jgi:TATA-box binding protein (TBP) (component of TFIID and TFIIIB)
MRVSTITATATLGVDRLELNDVYESIHPETSGDDHATVKSVALGDASKGERKVRRPRATTERRRSYFSNQLTVVLTVNGVDGSDASSHVTNVKIFTNGAVQMTGVRSEAEGRRTLETVASLIRCKPCAPTKYAHQLVNCDFKLPFPIERTRLYELVVRRLGMCARFEPCIYPGVKIAYFYNSNKDALQGSCACAVRCHAGKGDGHGAGKCKRVTLLVFQSGHVIATGARTVEQASAARDFLLDLVMSNRDDVEK